MGTYVIRIWLPDRPGALGQVASRIGAVRGDVVGIDILERDGGQDADDQDDDEELDEREALLVLHTRAELVEHVGCSLLKGSLGL